VLLDPSQPVSGGNPLQVDSGLPNQDPCSVSGTDCSNANNDTGEATSYTTGSISSSQVSGIHSVATVYIKGGKLYMVNLTGSSHTPVQVSNLSNLCGLDQSSSQQLTDYSNIGSSWVLVGQPGPDNVCYDADDVQTLVQLSTPAGSAPPAVSNLQGAIAQHNASGAITGFFDGEGGSTITIVHRDASLGSPSTAATVASGGQVGVFQAGVQAIYFTGPLAGSAQQLFLATATGLSAPLYTFVNGDPHQAFKHAGSDTNNLYFADGNLILSLPRSGGTASTLTTLASGLALSGNIKLTSSRLVFQAASASNPATGGVYSVASNASNAAATALALNSQSGTSFTSVLLQVVDPSGLVYINETVGGTGGISNSALLVHDNGSGQTTLAGQWLGEVDSVSIANVNAQLQTVPASILFGAPGSGGSLSLSAYSSSSGTLSASLGSIANANFASGFGLAPYFQIIANVQYGSVSKNDAYIAGSSPLAAVSANNVTTGNNQGNNSYVGE
jgi:hypothetical protein